jgi:hypothetical protein
MALRKGIASAALILVMTSCGDGGKNPRTSDSQPDTVLDEILHSQEERLPFMVNFGMPTFVPDEKLKALIARYRKQGVPGVEAIERRLARAKLSNWEVVLMIEVLANIEGEDAHPALGRLLDRVKAGECPIKDGQYPFRWHIIRYIELKLPIRERPSSVDSIPSSSDNEPFDAALGPNPKSTWTENGSAVLGAENEKKGHRVGKRYHERAGVSKKSTLGSDTRSPITPSPQAPSPRPTSPSPPPSSTAGGIGRKAEGGGGASGWRRLRPCDGESLFPSDLRLDWRHSWRALLWA